MSVGRRLGAVDPRVAAGLVAITAAALWLRWSLIQSGNSDIDAYMDWLAFIREQGGWHAFHYGIGDYTPFFPYLLYISDTVLVGARDLLVIKASSIVADVVCAAFVYKIVRLRHPHGPLPLIAYGVLLFTPTVFVNSTYWGQTDMLWVAPIVGAVYFVLRGEPLAAALLGAIAFSVKQQPVFLAPFLLVLLIERLMPWRYLLLIPAVYVAMIAPAALLGRDPVVMLKIYVDQAGKYKQLTLNAPTAYQWLPEADAGSLARPGTIWGVCVLLLLVLATVAYVRVLTPTLLLALATASVLTSPFVLPRMHERYFFAADVLTIVLAFYVPRLVGVALVVQLVSFFSYWPFLFEEEPVPEELLAFFELLAIVVLLAWIALEIRRQLAAHDEARDR